MFYDENDYCPECRKIYESDPCFQSANNCKPKPCPPKPCCCQGPQGLKGDKGDTGDAGPAGEQGLKGDKGDTGDAGPPVFQINIQSRKLPILLCFIIQHVPL